MPAASAVGVDADRLILVDVAGEAVPEHFENPRQTPAYRYPAAYGPRPPSFARATRVTTPSGTWSFISGTAAILGSASLHPGDFAAQLAVMRDNLEVITRLAAPVSGMTTAVSRVYVKPGVVPGNPEAITGVTGPSVAIATHICRAELLLEAEITLYAPDDYESKS